MLSINEIDETILVRCRADVAGDVAGQTGKFALEASPTAGMARFTEAGFKCAGQSRRGER